jgi:hypothetical protein
MVEGEEEVAVEGGSGSRLPCHLLDDAEARLSKVGSSIRPINYSLSFYVRSFILFKSKRN